MGVANPIAYLPFGLPRPIIFKDIKPSNILLDESYVVKLFNFSISESILEGETNIKAGPMTGTFGFMAPASYDNEKFDVYNFGALLLVLLTGNEIHDIALYAMGDYCALPDYVKSLVNNDRFSEVVNPAIVQDGSYRYKELQLLAFVQLIIEYSNLSAEDRPTMIDVAKQPRKMYRSPV